MPHEIEIIQAEDTSINEYECSEGYNEFCMYEAFRTWLPLKDGTNIKYVIVCPKDISMLTINTVEAVHLTHHDYSPPVVVTRNPEVARTIRIIVLMDVARDGGAYIGHDMLLIHLKLKDVPNLEKCEFGPDHDRPEYLDWFITAMWHELAYHLNGETCNRFPSEDEKEMIYLCLQSEWRDE